MAAVNRYTEEWAVEHRGKPLDELVRIGAEVRGDTLQLLEGIAEADETDAELRKTAKVVQASLKKKALAK